MNKPTFHVGNKTSFTIPEKYRSIFSTSTYTIVNYVSQVTSVGTINDPMYWSTGNVTSTPSFSSYNSSTGKGTISISKRIGDAWSTPSVTCDFYLVPNDEKISI